MEADLCAVVLCLWGSLGGGGAGSGTGAGACRRCGAALAEPYVSCWACPGRPSLCLECFARGAEFPGHASSHPYSLEGRCCPLEEGWGGGEELALLGAVEECGLGNWEAVSARMPGRAPHHCRDHYHRHYLTHPPPELARLVPTPPTLADPPHTADPIEYVAGTEQPPRPLPGTPAAASLAGYCAARGDFLVEADPAAEAILAEVDPELFEGVGAECPGAALVVAVADAYRRRVAERHHVRRVVRDAGLLVGAGRLATTLARLRPTLPSGLMRALPRLLTLVPGQDLEEVVAGLAAEWELRQQVQQLREYRQAGITRQAGVATYETLRRRREATHRERECLVSGGAGRGGDWKVEGRCVLSRAVLPGVGRRARPPLDVSGMPGYEGLTRAEREACAELHMPPEAFLRHKRLLVGEARRCGGLRLAQARTLLKIDVNKTRRIYDTLQHAGDITAITAPHARHAANTTASTTTTTETLPS
ncbi:Transcriptional adapter 2-alpha [Portunus trituberculatus]|uniref:Transcriptional adapter 2-alpha n=2 Tax=Portunus trituberculatus TaxID=210409 RepID=A0A5B7HSM6_PORTR|nr:Transcriptional adapter 2-alpha [Portunus trituberculatus]